MRPPDDKLFFSHRDGSAVLELRGAVWGVDHPHTTSGFIEWLYADNDPAQPDGVLLRRPEGGPISFIGLCVKRLLVNGSSTKLALGLDNMTHPGLSGLTRGRTAVKSARDWIALARSLDCSYALGFPNESAKLVITSGHVGMTPIFSPTLMVRPLAKAALEHRIHARLPRSLGTLALRAAAVGSALASGLRARDGEPASAEAFGSEYDGLWSRVAPEVGVAVVRDARYLTWRYLGHPLYDYRRFAWRRGGRLEGFAAVAARSVSGVKTMLLVELMSSPWDGPAATGLIDAVVRDAARSGQDMVASLAIPGSRMFRTLLRHGFYPVPRRLVPKPLYATGMVLGEAGRAASDGRAWHFTWGDTDVV